MTLPTTPSAVSTSGEVDITTGAAPPPDRRTDEGSSALNALELRAWLAFNRVRNDIVTALERDLSETDLSLGDYQVFVVLTQTEHQSMRMCDLAEELQLSPSGLTRRLDGLVKAGWIERQSSEHDRRVMLAVVTPSGRRAFEEAVPVHVRSVRDRITGVLTEGELQSMADIFDKIKFTLDGDDPST